MNRNLFTLLVIATSLSLISCRKELTYYDIERSIKVNCEVPSLDSLWGVEWQTALYMPWREESMGELGYTEPKTYINSIYKYRDMMCLYSHSMLCSSEPTPLYLNDGTYKFLICNTELNNTLIERVGGCTITATSRRVTDSIRRAPEVLYTTCIDSLEVCSDYTKLYHHNGSWHEDIICSTSPVTKIYIMQIITKYKGPRTFRIANLYLGNTLGTIELQSRKGRDECYTQCDIASIHRLSDTLTVARITTFGLTTMQPTIVIEYLDTATGNHPAIKRSVTIDKLQFDKGGIITLNIDLNMELDNNSQGGFKPTLDEWKSEDIGVDI